MFQDSRLSRFRDYLPQSLLDRAIVAIVAIEAMRFVIELIHEVHGLIAWPFNLVMTLVRTLWQ